VQVQRWCRGGEEVIVQVLCRCRGAGVDAVQSGAEVMKRWCRGEVLCSCRGAGVEVVQSEVVECRWCRGGAEVVQRW
jgi:hypothetical protein